MSIRVYVLAKELGLTSKDLLERLAAMDIAVKGHMSTLEEAIAERVKHSLTAQTPPVPEPEPVRIEEKPKKKAEKGPTPPVEKTMPTPPVPESAHPPVRSKPPRRVPEKKPPQQPATPVKAPVPQIPSQLKLSFPVTLKDLAGKLRVTPVELIKKLMKMNIMATINQALEEETVKFLGLEYGCEIERELNDEERLLEAHSTVNARDLEPRSPVVTFMGHVDHGKTSLLDAIRQSNVTKREAGGITQHIGAYQVKTAKGMITFLDTPGHEAFTAMRARGATVTDIVVLVVAADDGLMPQTLEAISHAQAAKAPIVVAINKIDLPAANLDMVKRQLAEKGLTPEDWGGQTMMLPVSAKTGEGIDTLLEMLLLESEMLELKASAKKLAEGVVVESKLSRGSGPVATILVQNGTLRVGDFFVCGLSYGKVRAMIDHSGIRLEQAGPSCPVEIIGISQVPQVGDKFYVVEDERKAKEISARKNEELRQQRLMPLQRMSLEHFFEKAKQDQVKELKLIVKADVQGSLEALQSALNDLSTPEIAVNIIHGQVGSITDSDVMLAAASEAVIIGFHTSIEAKARDEADRRNVDVRLYRIIYEAIDAVRQSMEGILAPMLKETFLGRAKVLQVFKLTGVGRIAGCFVEKGKMVRNAEKVLLLRGGDVLYEGKFDSLKRYKDDVKEVSEGMECGMGLQNYSDYGADDLIECYRVERVARKL